MAKNDTAAAPATPTPESTYLVEILINGIVIGEAHHAAGKQMHLPKSQVDALMALTPPAVQILGIP